MVGKLIAFVVPLGLDTFAVAAALGLAGLPPRTRMRVSLLMACFEAAMPLVGFALGSVLGRVIGAGADYLAIGILCAFGVYTLLAARDEAAEKEPVGRLADVSGWPAVMLGLSISLDELAVGFTIGLLRLPVYAVVVLIGAQAFIVSQIGMRLGGRLSERMRDGAERLAGLALVALGIVLLLQKTL